MDNVTHTLTGLALSRAGLDRLCPRAVWLLMLSANAPDGDIVAAYGGSFRYLEAHRGYTHSLLGMPCMAALSVAVVALLFRERLPWFRAGLLCLAGIASHLLLDCTNTYGVRLLLPFSSRWFHCDLNSLYDAFILIVLAFAALWPAFSRLVNREIGDRRSAPGRAVAVAALCFFLFFDFARTILHNRVVAALESRLYDEAPAVQAAALPNAFNPFRWTAVVETSRDYRTAEIDLLAGFHFEKPSVFYKPAVTPAIKHVAVTDPFRYFLYFARFPVWSTEPVFDEHSRETRFDLTDLRFGVPGGGAFHCVGRVNERGELTEKWFTYKTGSQLGWSDGGQRSEAAEKGSQ